jgi:hypothetical protein
LFPGDIVALYCDRPVCIDHLQTDELQTKLTAPQAR